MHDLVKALALAGGLLLAACQTTPRPFTDYDPEVDFSRFQSFSWIDSSPVVLAPTAGPLSPLIQRRLMRETRDVLSQRGFRFVKDPREADFVVAFTVGTREGIRVSSYPTRSFHRGTRTRHHAWGPYWQSSAIRTRRYTEGQLAIDLFGVAEARPVWHGTVSQRITRRDREEPDAVLRTAVEAILARFPPS